MLLQLTSNREYTVFPLKGSDAKFQLIDRSELQYTWTQSAWPCSAAHERNDGKSSLAFMIVFFGVSCTLGACFVLPSEIIASKQPNVTAKPLCFKTLECCRCRQDKKFTVSILFKQSVFRTPFALIVWIVGYVPFAISYVNQLQIRQNVQPSVFSVQGSSAAAGRNQSINEQLSSDVRRRCAANRPTFNPFSQVHNTLCCTVQRSAIQSDPNTNA